MLASLLLALPLTGAGVAGDPEVVTAVLRGRDAPLVLLEQTGHLEHRTEAGGSTRRATRRVALAGTDFRTDGTKVVACRSAVFRARVEEHDTLGRELTAVYPVRRPDPPRRARRPGEPPSFAQCSPPARVRAYLFTYADSRGGRRSIAAEVRRRSTLPDAQYVGPDAVDAWIGGAIAGALAGETWADPVPRCSFPAAPLSAEGLEVLAARVPRKDEARLREARFTGWRFDPEGIHLTLIADGLELRLALEG